MRYWKSSSITHHVLQAAVSNSAYHIVVTQSVARQLCVAAVPKLVENRGNDLVATITVMLVIATLAVLLRLYARRISRSKLGVDDYLILVALVHLLPSILTTLWSNDALRFLPMASILLLFLVGGIARRTRKTMC